MQLIMLLRVQILRLFAVISSCLTGENILNKSDFMYVTHKQIWMFNENIDYRDKLMELIFYEVIFRKRKL